MTVPRKLTPKMKDTVIRVYSDYLDLSKRGKSIAYFFLGDRAIRYQNKSNQKRKPSRILYIGKTTDKMKRPFDALKWKALKLLQTYGMKELDVVYVQTKSRSGREPITKKLETAFLSQFEQMFGCRPKGNEQSAQEGNLFKKYFNRDKVREIIEDLSKPKKHKRRKKRRKGIRKKRTKTKKEAD